MTTDEDAADPQLEADPALFDPMSKPYWTLPMAVAWIASKSADAVRAQWDDWLKQCHRRQCDEDGCYWVAERAASLAVLIGTTKNEAAWHELRNALLKGEAKGGLDATGISTKVGERGTIPAAEWNDLDNYPTGTEFVEKFRYPPTSSNPERGYDEILVASADVLHLWSAGPTAGTVSDAPANVKRRPGPRPRYEKAWNDILKPMALEIYAETGPYDRRADALQSTHIELIIERFKHEHPRKECPSPQWFKPKLRAIQKEMDDFLAQRHASDN